MGQQHAAENTTRIHLRKELGRINGLISAVISFVRTLICQIAAVLLLPLILGLDGIWWAIVVSEGVALVLTIFCFVKFKGRYHYM